MQGKVIVLYCLRDKHIFVPYKKSIHDVSQNVSKHV